MYTGAHRSQKKVADGSPQAGIIGDCELPGSGARNQTKVLCKNGKALILNHLSSPEAF